MKVAVKHQRLPSQPRAHFAFSSSFHLHAFSIHQSRLWSLVNFHVELQANFTTVSSNANHITPRQSCLPLWQHSSREVLPLFRPQSLRPGSLTALASVTPRTNATCGIALPSVFLASRSSSSMRAVASTGRFYSLATALTSESIRWPENCYPWPNRCKKREGNPRLP